MSRFVKFCIAVEEVGGRRVLRNRTLDGREQAFDQLVFHGATE